MRLNQVTAPVRDVAEAKAFYEMLGLRLIVDNPPGYARFECPDGDATFSVELDADAAGGGALVYFECDDLDADVARLQSAGLHFESAPVDQPWMWREAYLKDPSGNRLCLYHAGANRRFPPWRVDGRSE